MREAIDRGAGWQLAQLRGEGLGLGFGEAGGLRQAIMSLPFVMGASVTGADWTLPLMTIAVEASTALFQFCELAGE